MIFGLFFNAIYYEPNVQINELKTTFCVSMGQELSKMVSVPRFFYIQEY